MNSSTSDLLLKYARDESYQSILFPTNKPVAHWFQSFLHNIGKYHSDTPPTKKIFPETKQTFLQKHNLPDLPLGFQPNG